jgi:hypothetical protein
LIFIRTYQFNYDRKIDGYDEIQFCAENYREAKRLFEDWAAENGHSIREYKMTVVYNKEDADEYENIYAL